MFRIEDPENPLEPLCSIAAEAPSQLAHDDKFGLLVGAWFDTDKAKIPTEDGNKTLEFGISSALLVVDTCKNSNLPINPRYERTAYRVSYSLSESKETSRSGGADGEIGFETPKLKFFAAKAKAGGEYKRAVAEQQAGAGEFIREYKDVWQSGQKSWRLAAVEPDNEDAILSGKALGDDPLCDIETPHGEAEVTVSLIVPFSDIWVKPERTLKATGTLDTDEENRTALYRALCARALKKRGHKADPDDPDSQVILARAKLSRTKTEDQT